MAFLLARCHPREASVMQNAQVSPLGTHANSAPSRKAFFSIVSAPGVLYRHGNVRRQGILSGRSSWRKSAMCAALKTSDPLLPLQTLTRRRANRVTIPSQQQGYETWLSVSAQNMVRCHENTFAAYSGRRAGVPVAGQEAHGRQAALRLYDGCGKQISALLLRQDDGILLHS